MGDAINGDQEVGRSIVANPPVSQAYQRTLNPRSSAGLYGRRDFSDLEGSRLTLPAAFCGFPLSRTSTLMSTQKLPSGAALDLRSHR